MKAGPDAPGPDDLWTISAAGFSATVDAYARDPESHGLWFLSMVGSQTALKAIWAALLKQPPEPAHLAQGADGTALSGGYRRCAIPQATVGTWTTKIARLPATGGWHALVFTKLAQYGFESDSFLLLAGDERRRPFPAPQVPGQKEPPAAAPLLGRLALGQGHRNRRDRSAGVGRHRRLPLPPRRRAAARGPVRGRRLRDGEAHRGRPEPGPDNGRVSWIGPSGRPNAETGSDRSAT